ncbi:MULTISPECIES: OTU domain-containing protein [unclassified Endozoicomonas]|uniref:OTU domain-containing protein n=1 Tax=unclassified Endozoicomonas TaxID=2644528 RepID=UPI003BB72882
MDIKKLRAALTKTLLIAAVLKKPQFKALILALLYTASPVQAENEEQKHYYQLVRKKLLDISLLIKSSHCADSAKKLLPATYGYAHWLKCRDHFNFYTHVREDLTRVDYNNKIYRYLELERSTGRLTTQASNVISLHDLLEYEPEDPNATPSFWQFVNRINVEDKTDITGLLFQYFTEYPEKLIQLLNSDIIYPLPGFFSKRDNTSELYSMAMQIRLILIDNGGSVTKPKNDFLLAYSVTPVSNPMQTDPATGSNQESEEIWTQLTDQEKEFVGRLNDALHLGMVFTLADLYKRLSQALSTTNFDNMTTAELLDIIENKPIDGEKELAAWELHKLSSSVIQLKGAVYETIKSTYMSSVPWLRQRKTMRFMRDPDRELEQQRKFAQEQEQALRLFVNRHISNINALLRLLPDQNKTQLPFNPQDSVTLSGVSYSALKNSANKYKNGQTQQQWFSTENHVPSFTSTPDFSDLNADHRSRDDSEKPRGFFMVSAGSNRLPEGIKEVVVNSPITAPELLNEGIAKLDTDDISISKMLQVMFSIGFLRPGYSEIDAINFIAAYSYSPLHSALWTLIFHAIGVGDATVHPHMHYIDGYKRKFIFNHLAREDIAQQLSAIHQKLQTTTTDGSEYAKQLNELLEQKQLTLGDTPGDGHCFTHALAQQLPGYDEESIRRALQIFLASPSNYQGYVPESIMSLAPELLAQISSDGPDGWIDISMAAFASLAFGRSVVVIHPQFNHSSDLQVTVWNQGQPEDIDPADVPQHIDNALILVFINTNHWTFAYQQDPFPGQPNIINVDELPDLPSLENNLGSNGFRFFMQQ